MSEVRVTEFDVTKQTEGGKKVSFWLSRAQTRLAYLATVSCGIQGRPVLLMPPAASTIPPLLSNSAPFLLSMTRVFMITSGGGTN